MTDSERQQVLKMVEEGKITAQEGLTLIQALAEDEEAVEVVDIIEAEPASGETRSDPDFDPKIQRFRRLWMIPLYSGILLSVASAWGMYSALQSSGIGFWFYSAFLFFLLGVAITALGFDSRTSRWIYVNVHQKPGEKPEHIVITFPFSAIGWLVNLAGNHIPAAEKGAVDDIIRAIFRSTQSSEPFFVDVHDDDGQHVQVYIG